ncbi:hypothetical protein [Ruminococcus sp.]|uniref:hypothetical protein n=1 Tax=Ruminococcus sp. TaxID=41978 RepID=UPI0025CDD17F|nr:hypothetical protein [Ruminococcus sp.]MCR4640242.1 hypothetical protein [Ruminococcus sp.]
MIYIGKHIKRTALGAALAAAVIFGGAGCNKNDAAVPVKDGQALLMESLDEKYGEHFTFVDNAGGGTAMQEHCAIHVRSEKLPDDTVYAVRGVFDGKTENRDNYMAYYLRSDAEAYLQALAEQVYGRCRVFYAPDDKMVLPADMGKDSTAQEMLRASKCYYSVLLPSGQDMSQKEKKLDELLEKLREEKIRCYFYIAYLDSDKFYDFAESVSDVDKAHITADCTVGMDDEYNITDKKWG